RRRDPCCQNRRIRRIRRRGARPAGITSGGEDAERILPAPARLGLKRKEELGVRPGHPRFSGNVFAMTAVTVLGLSALAACTSSSTSSGAPAATSQPTGPITIGASLSLTGDFSADGQAFERGYQLWAKD